MFCLEIVQRVMETPFRASTNPAFSRTPQKRSGDASLCDAYPHIYYTSKVLEILENYLLWPKVCGSFSGHRFYFNYLSFKESIVCCDV